MNGDAAAISCQVNAAPRVTGSAKGRLLVAYSNLSNHVSTTADYLNSIARYSCFDVHYVHVTHDAELDFDLNEFDAVFQSYCARLPFDGYISASYIEQIKSFRGIKVLAVQDEYDAVNKFKQRVQEIGYHIVLSNAPRELLPRLYPPVEFPETEFISVLTGYVPESLAQRNASVLPLSERPIVIGYRGREIGPRYGRLGFDKFEIGQRMREICVARGIQHDIELSEEKRLYGEAWFRFLGSCRATLGSESGSNVFDFDGSIAAKEKELAALRGGRVSYEEFRSYTDHVEAEYDMGQISPRVFEAAAMRTPLILFSGRYSGLIEPDEHYIELKKDFSNVDAVLARLDDLDALERMAERAYRHLVGSEQFSYRRFVGLIDEKITRKSEKLGTPLRPAWVGAGTSTRGGEAGAALAGSRERPTATPRDPMTFLAMFFYPAEIARVNEVYSAEITRLNTIYPAEIARLNTIYPAEIARLDTIYPAEISRLNEVYSAEIARLNTVLQEEIARFNNVRLVLYKGIHLLISSGVLKIRRCVEWMRTGLRHWQGRADVLRTLAGDGGGRSVLWIWLGSGSKTEPQLADAVRMVLARKLTTRTDRGGDPVVLVPHLRDGKLDIYTVPKSVAASLDLSQSGHRTLAEVNDTRISDYSLKIIRNTEPRTRWLDLDHYSVPSLGPWLDENFNSTARLIFGTASTPAELRDAALPSSATHYFDFLSAAVNYPELVPLLHDIDRRRLGVGPASPFDRDRPKHSTVPAEPRHRSVLFLHNCYYNFKYLAAALRERGWDAIVANLHPPDGPDSRYFHGEDTNLWDPDPVQFKDRLSEFFEEICGRFGIVHSYGVGVLSLYPGNYDIDATHGIVPWDVLEWRRHGILIGYTHVGCNDGASQSAFRKWSPGSCARCPWRERPDICSDSKNLAWGRKLEILTDLICTETDVALDSNLSPKAFRDPLTMALEPEIWHPDLEPPEHLRRARTRSDEVLVYHGVGNYAARTLNGVNIKGTRAVVAAIEALREEGIPIRLDFVDDVPSIDNRFIQVQADIVVDQLNYGRYGATAREGMMLGKPVVARINPWDGDGIPASRCILTTPIVNADEETIKDVLRDLALDAAKRKAIGRASREHALKWWGAPALAGRFERVYDIVRETGRPPRTVDEEGSA